MPQNSNGNGWKNVAIAAGVSLIVGGGLGDWRASARIRTHEIISKEARSTQLERIKELEREDERNFDIILRMADRLARIETKLDDLRSEN
mgnify:CR=1 FL=1|tara:strand:+ start:273 stop:542 length:270 start_codon:yes stop_codon:yes gene_type:complete